MSYDVAYQEWLTAYDAGDFATADRIRDEFEQIHGLTIFARGDMPIEGVTVRRMTLSKWLQKFQPTATSRIHATQKSDGIHHTPLLAYGEAI